MYKKLGFAFIACLAASSASAIDVDGNLDAGYGASQSSVAYLPAVPGTELNSNFGAPTPYSNFLGYNVFLTATGGNVYGYLQGTDGNSIGAFANLYFGDPGLSPPGRGSVIGFEINNLRAFEPGVDGYVAAPGISFAAVGNNLEFAIPQAYFTAPLGNIDAGFSAGDTVSLRLSQAFGYTVAGGGTYGDKRLGVVTLGNGATAVPGPVAGAGLIPLFGLAGAWYARRRKQKLAA